MSVFRWDPEAEARLGFMRTSCRSQESSEKGQKGKGRKGGKHERRVHEGCGALFLCLFKELTRPSPAPRKRLPLAHATASTAFLGF